MQDRRSGTAGGLFALALAAFVMLGLSDGSIGVAWPSMRAGFERGISELGLLLAFMSAGYLTASTGYGWAHARLGTGTSLGVGATAIVLGLAGFALAPAWALIAASAAILGLGGGLVDAGMNAHAALEFDVGSINLLHASYGVGATAGPLLMAASLAAGAGWSGGYGVLVALQIGITALLWRTRTGWVASPDQDPIDEPRSLRARAPALLFLFLVYTGVEVATGQWAFSLLSEGRGMSTGAAGVWVAAYWGGLTAGRFSFGFLGGRIRPSRILDGSMAVALGGIALLWWDPGGLGMAGLPIAGVGLAAVFPTLVSLTPSRIGRRDSTRMMGYQLAAANVGAATLPWALGLLAEGLGLAALAPGLLAAGALLAVVHLWTDRRG